MPKRKAVDTEPADEAQPLPRKVKTVPQRKKTAIAAESPPILRDGVGSSSSDDGSDESDAEIQLGGSMQDADTGAEKGRKGKEKAKKKEELVSVNFDFCDPAERFFGGIRALMQSYLAPQAALNIGDLVDVAVKQASVGTVIAADNGDDVYAFATVLPLQFHKDAPWVSALLSHLSQEASSAGLASEWRAVTGDPPFSEGRRLGLLVHERMVNLPLKVVPKMHESLQEDLKWALDNEISQEHKDKFKFDHLVLIAPCDLVGLGTRSSATGASDLYHSKFDDEIFQQEAEFWFTMREQGSHGDARARKGSVTHKAVIVMRADAYSKCTDQIAALAS